MRFGDEEALWEKTATSRGINHTSVPLSFLPLVSSSILPPPHPPLPFLLSYSMKISSLFLGVGSNTAFRWGIHLGFWLFRGVFGPMSWRARQHLFSWIPNGCVSPESNACTERRSHCYYHHGYLATSFSLGSFLFLVPMEGTIGLAASFYSIC